MNTAGRQAYRHFVPVSLHWGDMDVLGHVNNVLFFRYVETGRIEYFNRILGDDPKIWGGEGPILADIQCSFLHQLRYPAEIEVATRTLRLGGRSLTLEAAVFRKDEVGPVATSRAVVVWFNYAQQRSVQLPDALRKAIRGFEAVAPEE